MTSQWPGNCDASTWKVIFNELDIDFIHDGIPDLSCKKVNTSHEFSAKWWCNHNLTTHNTTVCILVCITQYDDAIKWKHFPRYWPLVRGIHRSPVNSPHKGQWCGALIFSLMDCWVNNREAGDLRRHRAYYDVTVMRSRCWVFLVTAKSTGWRHGIGTLFASSALFNLQQRDCWVILKLCCNVSVTVLYPADCQDLSRGRMIWLIHRMLALNYDKNQQNACWFTCSFGALILTSNMWD